jgi:hypothetical protein
LKKKFASYSVVFEPEASTLYAYLSPIRQALYSIMLNSSDGNTTQNMYALEVVASDTLHSQAVVNQFPVTIDKNMSQERRKLLNGFQLKEVLKTIGQKAGRQKKVTSIMDNLADQINIPQIQYNIDECAVDNCTNAIDTINNVFLKALDPTAEIISDKDELLITLSYLMFIHYCEPYLVHLHQSVPDAKLQIRRTVLLCIISQLYSQKNNGDILAFNSEVEPIIQREVTELSNCMQCSIHTISAYLVSVWHVVALFHVFRIPVNLFHACFNGRAITHACEDPYFTDVIHLTRSRLGDKVPAIVNKLWNDI